MLGELPILGDKVADRVLGFFCAEEHVHGYKIEVDTLELSLAHIPRGQPDSFYLDFAHVFVGW